MSILNLSPINDIINKLKNSVRKNKFESNILPKFIFICGEQILDKNKKVKSTIQLKKDKNKRQVLIEKLENISNNNVICVISEKIFSDSLRIDSLTFEELLAELSDKIIIIVESYGTVCELGAFTVKDEYMKKLLVINDQKFSTEPSFINEGPVRKIKEKNESNYILANYDYKLFKTNFQITESLKNISQKNLVIYPNNKHNELDLKNLIYELLNIIELFQPLDTYELFYIYKNVKGFDKINFEIKNRTKHGINSPNKIVALMEKMELIKINNCYISKNGNHSCYNALFNIDRTTFNILRGKIIYQIIKKYPERLEGDEYENITINE